MEGETRNHWIKALKTAGVIFLILSFYLFIRRGYFNLYIANKVFGSTAVILAGITLILWPLSRVFPFLSLWLPLRRELGLVAFLSASIHMIISLFFLPQKFALPWFINEWLPVLFGFIAIITWTYLTSLSTNHNLQQINPKLWRYRQHIFGQLGFLAIYLHLVIMKYNGWILWWKGLVKASPELANPNYPPASLFVFFLMSAIILIRIPSLFVKKSNL